MADQQTAESATDAAEETQDETTSETEDQQQQTDDGNVRQLTEALKKANRDAERNRRRARELEESRDRDVNEAKKTADERAQAAEQRATDAETRLLVFEVALDKQLPADLIPLLSGKDRDEIAAKADALKKHLKPATATDFDSGARETAEEQKTPEQQHQEFLSSLLGGRAPTP